MRTALIYEESPPGFPDGMGIYEPKDMGGNLIPAEESSDGSGSSKKRLKREMLATALKRLEGWTKRSALLSCHTPVPHFPCRQAVRADWPEYPEKADGHTEKDMEGITAERHTSPHARGRNFAARSARTSIMWTRAGRSTNKLMILVQNVQIRILDAISSVHKSRMDTIYSI